MLAFAKLDGRVDDRKITFRGHQNINIILLIASLAYGVFIAVSFDGLGMPILIGYILLSLIYGFSFVCSSVPRDPF
jgi:NAD/NADP transhydrogenase beta subunit